MGAASEAIAMDRRAAVVVADALELRRAGLISLMQSWSDAHRVQLRAIDPEAADATLGEGIACVLGIFNLGSTSIATPGALDTLRRFKERCPDAPTVVVSDLEDADEVVFALRSGVQGFIPSRTAPRMALQTLSFIMGGGSFFPPGALLDSPQRRVEPPRKGERELPSFSLVPIRPQRKPA